MRYILLQATTLYANNLFHLIIYMKVEDSEVIWVLPAKCILEEKYWRVTSELRHGIRRSGLQV